MIKANELRVGNWVLLGAKKRLYHEVDSICAWGEGTALHPIPLTPEILEKCGFRQQGKRNLYSDGKLAFMEDADGFTFFIKDVSNVLYKSVANSKIYYLHQLQNLYFALTGDELKIEL